MRESGLPASFSYCCPSSSSSSSASDLSDFDKNDSDVSDRDKDERIMLCENIKRREDAHDKSELINDKKCIEKLPLHHNVSDKQECFVKHVKREKDAGRKFEFSKCAAFNLTISLFVLDLFRSFRTCQDQRVV